MIYKCHRNIVLDVKNIQKINVQVFFVFLTEEVCFQLIVMNEKTDLLKSKKQKDYM